jgi:hypothetical protein
MTREEKKEFQQVDNCIQLLFDETASVAVHKDPEMFSASAQSIIEIHLNTI